MGSIEVCCIAPHAPVIVPDVGGSERIRIGATTSSLESLRLEIEEISPDTVILVSPPHLAVPGGSFPVMCGQSVRGSLSRFRTPGVTFEAPVDTEFVDLLRDTAGELGVELSADRTTEEEDWGALVPLMLLAPQGAAVVALRASPFLSLQSHRRLGEAVRRTVGPSGRRCVFIASGDLSHRLTPDAPSGYSPAGRRFDESLLDVVGSGDLDGVFAMDAAIASEAGEDCLWSISVLAGVVDGKACKCEVLSYEGTFGVGYLVARISPT